MAEIRIVLNIFNSKYMYSTENKKVYFIFKEYFLLFNNSTICLYSGESRASSRANYVITHEKLCWSISFQNVYHNKRKVIKKI